MDILLVEDDAANREMIAEFFNQIGHSVTPCANAEQALRLYEQRTYPMVLTDIRMPGMSGLDLLKTIKQMPQGIQTDVVLYTGYGDMNSALDALRSGAYDYLLKPVSVRALAALTDRIAEHRCLVEENKVFSEQFQAKVKSEIEDTQSQLQQLKYFVAQTVGLGWIGAFSPSMRDIFQAAQEYHQDRSMPVIIEGETGVGKEIVARLIHYGDLDDPKPFVDVNCAAINPQLFENELFGHEANSYTGANFKGQKGKFDLAAGGTLFLDEIGELPLELQGKLLRVLQEKEYYRVGGLKKIKSDARIICATNADLDAKVLAGKFRRDLYYRLKVARILIPPLRERREDIIPLAEHFLAEFAKQKGKRFKRIHSVACTLLENYPWPGNVRELRNAIEWSVFQYNAAELMPEHLNLESIQPPAPHGIQATGRDILNPYDFDLPQNGFQLKKFEKTIAQKALQLHNGNKTRAALYLGISRQSLYSLLQ